MELNITSALVTRSTSDLYYLGLVCFAQSGILKSSTKIMYFSFCV